MVAQPPKNVIASQPIIDPSRAHTDILSEEQIKKTNQLREEKERQAAIEKERAQQQAFDAAKKEQAEQEKRDREAEQRKEAEQAKEAQKGKESERIFDGRSIKSPLEVPVAHGALPSEGEIKARVVDDNVSQKMIEAKRQAALDKLKMDRAKERERGHER